MLKFNKNDIDKVAQKWYNGYISNFGLSNSIRVVKVLRKLLLDEKKRRGQNVFGKSIK